MSLYIPVTEPVGRSCDKSKQYILRDRAQIYNDGLVSELNPRLLSKYPSVVL